MTIFHIAIIFNAFIGHNPSALHLLQKVMTADHCYTVKDDRVLSSIMIELV